MVSNLAISLQYPQTQLKKEKEKKRDHHQVDQK
jgi:hypothetical protein